MVYNSVIFLCFFLPLVLVLYYAVPYKFKNYILLAASIFFYAWGETKFVFVMLLSILMNYIFGLAIHKTVFWKPKNTKENTISNKKDSRSSLETKKNIIKKICLWFGLFTNIGILYVFKYFTFTQTTIQRFFGGDYNIVKIALPLGISFYTFQGISYLVDVYREEGTLEQNGRMKSVVQKNPITLALYIAMFPQLLAGPIIRYLDIKDALVSRKINISNLSEGIERFIIGLAKKVILANMIGEVSTSIFASDFSTMKVITAWAGAIAYTLELYFDFSGYSDMAIGLGKMFGFQLMENFNYPYISTSIREFWRRWHISLSTWFRNYLYIPLGGNRKGNVYLNLFIVFLVTGIWHGAAWGFLIWGLWHGLFIILERLFSNMLQKMGRMFSIPLVIRWLYTMFVVVTGWVVFKLVYVSQFAQYFKVMFGFGSHDFKAYDLRFYFSNQAIFFFVIGILACIPWKIIAIKLKFPLFQSDQISLKKLIFKRSIILLLFVFCFVFLINNSFSPFIYFQF